MYWFIEILQMYYILYFHQNNSSFSFNYLLLYKKFIPLRFLHHRLGTED